MKLINLLSILISEGYGNTLIAVVSDDYKFYVSNHQSSSEVDGRSGDLTYNQIKTKILDNEYSNNKTKIRYGVPNRMLETLINNKSKKIIDNLNVLKVGDRIRFVYNRTDEHEDEEYFDYIEMVIQKDNDKRFNIITSSFSKDGHYLRLMSFGSVQQPKVFLENYFHLNTIIL